MAMIMCPECGREISNKALACPYCGNPINMRQEILVVFNRRTQFFAAMEKLNIYVDGMVIGQLKNGESCSSYIMQGSHQLDIEEVSMGHSRITKGPLTVPDDATELHVELSISITGPNAEIIVKR